MAQDPNDVSANKTGYSKLCLKRNSQNSKQIIEVFVEFAKE